MPRELNKKCDLVDLTEFATTFWNFIQFRPCKFSLNFKHLFILSRFTFCLVKWTNVPRQLEQIVLFCRSF